MITSKPPRYKNAKWEDVPKNIQVLIKNIKESRRGIYIHGLVGTGKTHIAYGIMEYLHSVKLQTRVYNTTELIFDIKADFDKVGEDKKRHQEKMKNFNGLIIFDDIGAERFTEYVAEIFYLIINRRYNEMLPIVFTSNLTAGQLAEKTGDRIMSRIIGMCNVIELEGSDRRLKRK